MGALIANQAQQQLRCSVAKSLKPVYNGPDGPLSVGSNASPRTPDCCETRTTSVAPHSQKTIDELRPHLCSLRLQWPSWPRPSHVLYLRPEHDAASRSVRVSDNSTERQRTDV